MPKRRVLVTGGAGRIATMFRASVGDEWEFVVFDRKPAADVPDAIVGDLTDLPALERAARGCDAMVHLGAHPNPHRDYAGVIVPSNVLGTWNAFEAAARAGVRRVVFASTVQVEVGHPDTVRASVDMPAQPRNNYAASKVFGEHLGFLYARDRGQSVVCIRFGAVVVSMRRDEMIASGEATQEITLTERDCCRFIRRAVEADGVRYAVVPGYSRNAARIKDLAPLRRELGIEPVEDALAVYQRPEAGPRENVQSWVARAVQRDEESLAAARRGPEDIFLACAAGDETLARRLLDADRRLANAATGATSPFGPGDRPIHLAAARGHVALVKLLLEHGADANAPDEDGATPLHLAAWRGRAPVLLPLAAGGARVDAPDPEYQATPRDWAEYARQWECVGILRDLARERARPPGRPAGAAIRKLLVIGRPAATAAFRAAAAARFELVEAGSAEADALAGAAEGCDAVVQLAGAAPGAGFDALLREDVLGTWRVFEAARAAGAQRVVYASTAAVFGGWPPGTRITAGTPLRPDSVWSAVKALNEHLGIAYTRRAGLSVVSARLDGGAGDAALVLRALDAPADGPFVLPELPAA